MWYLAEIHCALQHTSILYVVHDDIGPLQLMVGHQNYKRDVQYMWSHSQPQHFLIPQPESLGMRLHCVWFYCSLVPRPHPAFRRF